MDIYSEKPFVKVWNCCHPSGYAGRVTEYYIDRFNKIIKERHFVTNSIHHRESLSGPAFESFYEDGTHSCIHYYCNGKLHRPVMEGPASIQYDTDGQAIGRSYVIHGVGVTP